MAQLSYSENMPLAVEGKQADAAINNLIEGTLYASGAIPFGRSVVKVTGEDDGVILPSATGQKFVGVSVLTQVEEQVLTTGVVEYDDKDPINVMRKGKIWVYVEEAVDPDTDSVYFRHTAGAGGSVIGRFRTDADTATADAVPNARFVTSTTAAGIAVIEINNP